MPTLHEIERWNSEVEAVTARIGACFSRREQRAHAGRYLQGLLARVERKNGWQLAEQLGETTPVNLQHFIARAEWSADAVRDDLQRYVVEQLGEQEGILILDETGFLKKGTKSVGVQRQYSGTAGRIENCQIGVFMAYRTPLGHALIDRALYLPQVWTSDPERRTEAKIPAETKFATKPALAREMLARTLAAGVPASWVTADEVYGSDADFRSFCENRRLPYVLAVSASRHVFLNGRRQAVSQHVQEIPAAGWQLISCGAGSKGEREYEWAFAKWPHHEQEGMMKGCLIRRSINSPQEHAFYFIYAPDKTPLETLVRVAGSRWAIEECFEQAKQETGLDEYEVRSWQGWYRHITLSMLAHATLAALRAQALLAAPKKQST